VGEFVGGLLGDEGDFEGEIEGLVVSYSVGRFEGD
jgi:hypothetical protein